MKNYYQTLNLQPDCELHEIKKRYRELALKFHPDKSNNDPVFEEYFKEIRDAYDVLSDEDKRYEHDVYHGYLMDSRNTHEESSSYNEEDYCYRADIYCDKGLIGHAYEEIHEGLKKFPNSGMLMYCWGTIFQRCGEYYLAIKKYDKAASNGYKEAFESKVELESFLDATGKKIERHYQILMYIIIIVTICVKAMLHTEFGIKALLSGALINIISFFAISLLGEKKFGRNVIKDAARYDISLTVYIYILMIGAIFAVPLIYFLFN